MGEFASASSTCSLFHFVFERIVFVCYYCGGSGMYPSGITRTVIHTTLYPDLNLDELGCKLEFVCTVWYANDHHIFLNIYVDRKFELL